MSDLTELSQLIRAHLNNCDPITTPTVCEMKATMEGAKQLEDDILSRCAQRGLSVGEAVLEIEHEYNSNWTKQ